MSDPLYATKLDARELSRRLQREHEQFDRDLRGDHDSLWSYLSPEFQERLAREREDQRVDAIREWVPEED